MTSNTEFFINKLICNDAIRFVSILDSNSIDAVITDPPYFLDKLDDKWSKDYLKDRLVTYSKQVVYGLPPGMRFNKEQGHRLYDWFLEVSKHIFRVLKPGGFFLVFSSPRLYHRVASAIDDAGFHIRDTFLWLYTHSQPKAMGLGHFVDKMKIDEEYKTQIKEKLKDYKTPQVKSAFEPIVVAQKPPEKTFLENFLKYNTGLFNTSIKIGQNKFPANVLIVDSIEDIIDKYFMIPKRGSDDEYESVDNVHLTVKPLRLIRYLVELCTVPEAIILDPFIGSGTTALAALQTKRKYIGVDINEEYLKIACERIRQIDSEYKCNIIYPNTMQPEII